jgi:hypothetical protein
VLAAAQQAANPPTETHKFQQKCGMTYEDVYRFAFRDGFVPALQALGEDMGREKLVEMLKSAASRASQREVAREAAKLPKRDLAAFLSSILQPNDFWKHVLTYEIVRQSDTEVEVKITECLWAKTLRGIEAADIGYAVMCHPDFATAPAFNPKMKMTRTKTLMQGHDCCNPHWVMET